MSGDMAISRRALIGGTGAAALAASMPAIAAPSTGKRPVDWVDPFIGTGGHGHTYPGATRPFGMCS